MSERRKINFKDFFKVLAANTTDIAIFFGLLLMFYLIIIKIIPPDFGEMNLVEVYSQGYVYYGIVVLVSFIVTIIIYLSMMFVLCKKKLVGTFLFKLDGKESVILLFIVKFLLFLIFSLALTLVTFNVI